MPCPRSAHSRSDRRIRSRACQVEPKHEAGHIGFGVQGDESTSTIEIGRSSNREVSMRTDPSIAT
jgi:hypothetical protein